jgi:D,D-heptose 1,7-bisphosphate phosphatase
MKVLVDGHSVPPASRLGHAALALAGRGHEVHWSGPGAPASGTVAGVSAAPAGLGLARSRVDALVAGGGGLFAAALRGRLGAARGLVAALELSQVARWGPADRWAWIQANGLGLLDPSEAAAARGGEHGLELGRLALWPDGEPAAGADPTHLDTEVLERALERTLARSRGRGLRPAVFLDRDGTLVRETGYLSDPSGLELLPGVAEALRALKAAGYALIVVSNQAGVGRGLYPLGAAHATMARLRRELALRGVELDGIYFCPHRPDEGCECRKPREGLLRRAAEDHQLDLPTSVMVGDKRSDVAAGHAAGGRGWLVRTGYGSAEESAGTAAGDAPDAVHDDLAAVARALLAGG